MLFQVLSGCLHLQLQNTAGVWDKMGQLPNAFQKQKLVIRLANELVRKVYD